MAPCQYQTAETLGRGTYSIVKRAVHITTHQTYACKIFDKELIRGREKMVYSEIEVLKKTAKFHPNILGLHDYFETSKHVYLCFDICTGGTLADPIRRKTRYHEGDVIRMVREMLQGIAYLHSLSIVHRDLKPDNVLFATLEEDSHIVIGDFGLSRILEDSKHSLITHCGTLAYMAPEIFRDVGYGAPVDMWALGVFAFFLLSGDCPFEWRSQEQCLTAIMKVEYTFEPSQLWDKISQDAKDFISTCLKFHMEDRPTAREALQHIWITGPRHNFEYENLLPYVVQPFGEVLKKSPLSFDIHAIEQATAATSHAVTDTNDSGVDVNELLAKFEKLAENTAKAVPTGTILTEHPTGHEDEHAVEVRRLLPIQL